jgi:hypothetical protein
VLSRSARSTTVPVTADRRRASSSPNSDHVDRHMETSENATQANRLGDRIVDGRFDYQQVYVGLACESPRALDPTGGPATEPGSPRQDVSRSPLRPHLTTLDDSTGPVGTQGAARGHSTKRRCARSLGRFLLWGHG